MNFMIQLDFNDNLDDMNFIEMRKSWVLASEIIEIIKNNYDNLANKLKYKNYDIEINDKIIFVLTKRNVYIDVYIISEDGISADIISVTNDDTYLYNNSLDTYTDYDRDITSYGFCKRFRADDNINDSFFVKLKGHNFVLDYMLFKDEYYKDIKLPEDQYFLYSTTHDVPAYDVANKYYELWSGTCGSLSNGSAFYEYIEEFSKYENLLILKQYIKKLL